LIKLYAGRTVRTWTPDRPPGIFGAPERGEEGGGQDEKTSGWDWGGAEDSP